MFLVADDSTDSSGLDELQLLYQGEKIGFPLCGAVNISGRDTFKCAPKWMSSKLRLVLSGGTHH